MNNPIKVLRIKDLTNKIGMVRSTIYDWLNPKSPRYDETFPKPFKIEPSSIGWFEHDVDSWLIGRSQS
ncbi:helix-turn-helix transcriptional regulator [Aeromonas hydrophila]|uniref:helix-turn-helix transcriptional regulator n=1 Tax=Aeromonas hydrophila TaxID=644 RepID=UPI00259EB2B7|nr:AlpA family phage regulatory protein [Aeromonas hydrophila]MDM5118602.1 AlpA family phage regulatory protein [Aeromonas hydrophila]